MKKITVLLLIYFTIIVAYSQTFDSVYLKNDSLIVCKILRHKPEKYVKVQVGGGELDIFRIKMKDVKRLVKDSALIAKEEKISLRKEKHAQRSESNCYFKGIVERNDFVGESYYKKGGFYTNICEIHGFEGFDKGKGTVGYFGTNLILGCQLNKKLFIGAGIGFNLDHGDDLKNGLGYPLFVDLRYYFTKKNTQPFINLSSGIMLNEIYLLELGNVGDYNKYHSFINPSAGVKVLLGNNHNIDISLGSSLLLIRKNTFQAYYDPSTHTGAYSHQILLDKIMGVIIKIGFTF